MMFRFDIHFNDKITQEKIKSSLVWPDRIFVQGCYTESDNAPWSIIAVWTRETRSSLDWTDNFSIS